MLNKIISSFDKKIYKEITLIEVVLLFVGFLGSTLVLILYFSLVPDLKSEDNFWIILIWFDVTFGIIAAVLLAKKWKYAWILLIFDAILYGAGFYHSGLYALAFVNVILIPLLLLISGYTWNYKKKYNTENNAYIEIRTMGKKEWFIASICSIVFIILASFFIFYFSNFNGDNFQKWWIVYTVIGAIIASIVMCAMLLSLLRYKGTFILFLICNLIKVPFFILVTIFFGLHNDLVMMTLFLMYSLLAIIFLVNSFYGLYNWSKKDLAGLITSEFNSKLEVKK